MDYSAVYEEAFRRTEFIEGRATNDKDDKGGVTGEGGLSLRYLKSLGQLADLDHDGDVDEEDLKLVTADQRKQFYSVSFWIGANCHKLNSRWLQIKVYDTACNVGPKRAQQILQVAYNTTYKKQIAEDGVLGPASIAAVSSMDDYVLLQSYRTQQELFYQRIVLSDSTQQKYLLGWKRRAYT